MRKRAKHKANILPFQRPARPQPRRRETPISWSAFIAVTAGMSAAVFMAVFLSDGGAAVNAAIGVRGSIDSETANFSICAGPVRRNCIVDGDTIWYDSRKIRIADINTPETGGAKCASERALGERAKYRLQDLMNEGGFTLESIDRDKDRYGRDLRIITRGGKSVGNVLVNEGLAEEWKGYRGSWC